MTARQPLDQVTTPVSKQPLLRRETEKGYKRERSFIDFLPWVEYLDDHKAVLLEDGRSVGAVFEINPIGTARTNANTIHAQRLRRLQRARPAFG